MTRKKAYCIELYDAGLIIMPTTLTEDWSGGYGTQFHYILDGEALKDLAEYFDLNYRSSIPKPRYVKGGDKPKILQDHLDGHEFKVEKRLRYYQAANLKEIYVEVLGTNLLEIELVFSGNDKYPDYHDLSIYSGAFLVGWDSEQVSDG